MESKNYFVVQGWMVTELGLRDKELSIYAILYGFSQGESSGFTGSASYLAEWLGISRRSVFYVLAELMKKSLVVKTEEGKGNHKVTRYTAIDPSANFAHPSANLAQEKERTKEKEDSINKTITNPPIVPPKGDDDFEQVWQAYKPTLRRDGKPCPKDSKAQAKVVYQALLKKHSAEEILTATKRYIEDCNTTLDYEGNPRYTMHVKTFLGSHTKGLGNEDYFQELLSSKSTEEQQVSFSNPEPFSRLDYLPEMDADKMMAVVHAHTTAWMLANPVWVDRIKRITNEVRARSSLNYHQKSLQMALELAKDIFRYKDSPEVRNSLVDPLFWLSHRSILTEVFIGTRGSGLFYVGYQLARLAEEG